MGGYSSLLTYVTNTILVLCQEAITISFIFTIEIELKSKNPHNNGCHESAFYFIINEVI